VASYTTINLRDLEDMAPKFGMAPDVSARFAARPLGLERSGISLQRLAPGVTQPFGHRHTEQEEIYVVVEGSGQVKLDDDIVDVRAWDAVRVSPDVTRAFSVGPHGLEFLAFGAPATGDAMADAEMKPGWWNP